MERETELFRRTLDLLGDDEFAALQIFMVRTLADAVLEKVDALYVFGQMPENAAEPLHRAAQWFNWDRTDVIALPDQRGRGNPAYVEPWIAVLKAQGLKESDIVPILATDPAEPNTMTESVALLGTCRKRGWRTLGITAAAFHLPRAFLTIASEIIRAGEPVKVYAVTPPPGDWTAVVRHPQGQMSGARARTIMHEMLRMASYANLVRPTAALQYLDARDR